MGIHTALDTNGFLGERPKDEEFSVIDLVLLDIKTWEPERHHCVPTLRAGAPGPGDLH